MRMYWGKATQIPTVAEVMPVNRFEKIKQFFHCNDNSRNLPKTHKDFDKLFKVRPVLDSVREKCQQLPQEQNHSVDEQIIATKSRTSLKQYLPNKPNKWGIKVWARCGVASSTTLRCTLVKQPKQKQSQNCLWVAMLSVV